LLSFVLRGGIWNRATECRALVGARLLFCRSASNPRQWQQQLDVVPPPRRRHLDPVAAEVEAA